jgi:hypothetical protein
MNQPIARTVLLAAAAGLAACAARAPLSTAPADSQDPLQVQIYDCRAAADDAARFGWVLRAPDARLLDARGDAIGRHFAGPSWELADGSSLVGEVKARRDSPEAGNIPWLLLAAKGTAGSGVLSPVAAIQRLHTEGGVAPAGGCDAAHAGAEARVPYKADYYFYAAAG